MGMYNTRVSSFPNSLTENTHMEEIDSYVFENLMNLQSYAYNVISNGIQDEYLYESTGVEEALLESIDNLKENARKYFEKIKTFIKNSFKKFREFIMRLIKGNRNFIKQYGDSKNIREYAKNCEGFEMKIHNGIDIDFVMKYPDRTAFITATTMCSAYLEELVKDTNKFSKGDLQDKFQSSKLIEKFYGQFIGESSISAEDLMKKAKTKMLGEVEPTFVSSSDIEKYINNFDLCDKILDELKKDETNLLNEIKKFEKEFFTCSELVMHDGDKEYRGTGEEFIRKRAVIFSLYNNMASKMMALYALKVKAVEIICNESARVIVKAYNQGKKGEDV